MENSNKPPKWFWIVVIILLIWNLLGVGSFISHVFITEEALGQLPEAEQELYLAFPAWATIAFAFATWGSTLGVVGLLLRKKWSRLILIAGFLGVLVQMYYNIFISHSLEVYGPGAVSMPIMILIVGAFLIWLSGHGIKKGWLN